MPRRFFQQQQQKPKSRNQSMLVFFLLSHSATIDEAPWVQVMTCCMEPAFVSLMRVKPCARSSPARKGRIYSCPPLNLSPETLPPACTDITTAASSTLRASEKQFLPTAEKIEKLLSLPPSRKSRSSSPFHRRENREAPLPSTAEKIEKLLSLLRLDSQTPSLRVTPPKPGGRTSGTTVAFVVQFTPGTALGVRLAEGLGERPLDREEGETERVFPAGRVSGEEPTTARLLDERKGTPGGKS